MKPLTLGSLFDGSGGFPLGGLLCGISPQWSSEIEPLCTTHKTRAYNWTYFSLKSIFLCPKQEVTYAHKKHTSNVAGIALRGEN